MRVRVEIECDGAAFEEYPGDEIARILRRLAGMVDDARACDLEDVSLRDGNGNRVVSFTVEDAPEVAR